jgi:outer membrane cobalamin receptor
MRAALGILLFALVSITAEARAADAMPRRAYVGRPLPEVILELERGGRLRVIYSSELVRQEMVVVEEPRPGGATETLRQILLGHALELRPGPAGSWLVVRSPRESQTPLATEGRFSETIEVAPSRVSILTEEAGAPHFLTRAGIERTPHISDDPFRVIPRLPGTAAGDLSTSFHIRGGEENETLVLIDGMEIAQPFHLRSFLNLFSVFDAKAIGSIEMSTGGFAADHGTKMAGVLDITSLSPREKPHFSLGLSLLSVDLLTDGSFAGGKGQWLLSARRGYLDLALKVTGDSDEFRPVYYDAFTRVQYQPSGATSISVNALWATDDVDFESTEDDERAAATARNVQGWVNVSTLLSPTLLVRTLGSIGTDRSSEDGTSMSDTDIAVRDRRTSRTLGLKQDWDWDMTDGHHLKLGLEARRLDASYDFDGTSIVTEPVFLALGAAPLTVRSARFDLAGSTYSAYVSDLMRLSSTVTAEVGVRWDRETYSDSRDVSPRVSIAYAPSPRTVFRAAWGLFTQSQGLHELHVEDGQQSFFPSQRAEHRVLSFEQTVGRDIRFKVEAYQKLIASPSPRYENLVSALSIFPELQPDRMRIVPDRSESRGVELLASREGTRFSWSASYGLAYAEDEVGGETFRRSWDQRHTLQLGLSWRPGKAWVLGTAFTYHSGWPTTDILLVRSGPPNEGSFGVSYGPRNGTQLPSYHRLDVRASRSFKLGWGTLTGYVDIFNVYNRENANSVEQIQFYLRQDGSIGTVKTYDGGLGLLPSFGLRLEF